MGMFDTVTFRYRMPDGGTESEYQTKDLSCECEFYEVSAEGRLLKWQSDVGGNADTNSHGSFTMTASDGCHLCFEQGTLKWIEVYSQGDKRWPFDPARFMADQDGISCRK
ncbi:hypothetical protein [Pantoea sp. BAV 3049]|uniref:hypothetical protein n=1 Tax=Pantoea sp. BAV 3049 TaxID=2654188 RepID=UPI00131C4D73